MREARKGTFCTTFQIEAFGWLKKEEPRRGTTFDEKCYHLQQHTTSSYLFELDPTA